MNNPNNPKDLTTLAVFWKAIASIVMWVMIAISFVITAIFLAPNMGDDVLGVVFMLLAAGILSSGFIWNWGSNGQHRRMNRTSRASAEDELYDLASNVGEKRKRDRLAVSLSQLSDGELVNLKERLRSGEIDEQDLAEILSEQGH